MNILNATLQADIALRIQALQVAVNEQHTEIERLRADLDRLRSDRDCEKRLRKDAEDSREVLTAKLAIQADIINNSWDAQIAMAGELAAAQAERDMKIRQTTRDDAERFAWVEPEDNMKEDPIPRVCAHGQLSRQCPQCDDAVEIARLRALLGRIRQWDALDTPDTDGAFWKREIDSVLTPNV